MSRATDLVAQQWLHRSERAAEARANGWTIKVSEEDLLMRDDCNMWLCAFREGRERETYVSVSRGVRGSFSNSRGLVDHVTAALDAMLSELLQTIMPFKPKGWRLFNRKATACSLRTP